MFGLEGEQLWWNLIGWLSLQVKKRSSNSAAFDTNTFGAAAKPQQTRQPPKKTSTIKLPSHTFLYSKKMKKFCLHDN
jgi:hypothetical protein